MLLDIGLARAVVIFLLVDPGGIAYPEFILSDTFNLALFVPAIFALGLHLKTGGWRWLIAAGLLLGAAAWVRPAAFLLPLVFAPVLMVAGRYRRVAFAPGTPFSGSCCSVRPTPSPFLVPWG